MQSCTRSSSRRLPPPGLPFPTPHGTALVVSNAPETISSQSPISGLGYGTLYKGSVQIVADLAQVATIRFYMWHVNATPVPLDFAILLQRVDGGPAVTLSPIRRQIRVDETNDLSIPGICLAKSQLFKTLDPVSGSLLVGASEVLAWSDTVASSRVLGVVYEFDLPLGMSATLQVRTVASQTSYFGTPVDNPIQERDPLESETHVRGWWPRNYIVLPANTLPFDVSRFSAGTTIIECSVCERNGPELDVSQGFGHQPPDIHGTANGDIGCYGADLTYRFLVENTNDQYWEKAFVYVRTRNNTGPPGKYWGAARITSPVLYNGFGVPVLYYYPPQHTNHPNFVSLVQVGELLIPPGGPLNLDVAVANGGAAPLPVNLLVSREVIASIPAQEPP